MRLQGEEVRDGRFHAWIERDDPTEIGRFAGERFFRFPSFFSERSNVDTHSLSSLGCGHNVIAVANLDAATQRINVTSSQGPTRDGRLKPDICAPGTGIRAAKGFTPDEELWVSMTGTSMASPYAAGVIGLMLAVNRKLTAAQCLGILQRTSNPLPGASFEWRDDAGFGAIDPAKAISEARTFSIRKELLLGNCFHGPSSLPLPAGRGWRGLVALSDFDIALKIVVGVLTSVFLLLGILIRARELWALCRGEKNNDRGDPR